RLVPLHPTAVGALRSYAACRDRLCPRPKTTRFFVSTVGTPLRASGVDHTFAQLTTALGLRTAACRPRVHDYADISVMPTSARSPCSEAVNARKLSA
ncbi:MAG TPA: hypothetical protein VF153_05070, partial [Candidatus Limnocylindria bacterium]